LKVALNSGGKVSDSI